MEKQNKGTKEQTNEQRNKGTKKQKVHPIGSGIPRSPGLVISKDIFVSCNKALYTLKPPQGPLY